VIDDRPVSLANVLWNLDDANLDPDVLADLRDRMECLGTFAPATHGGREVSGEAMAIVTARKAWLDAGSPDDGDERRAFFSALLHFDIANGPVYTDATAPTKPPREMSAPEWTGPDRWQHWAAEFAHHPDDHAGPAPAGFVQIGPWESVTFVSTSPSEPPIRDWRRPLRRVQG